MLRKTIKTSADLLKTSTVKTVGYATPTKKSPEQLGELFDRVQKERVYGDGKVFVDLIPRKRYRLIAEAYAVEKNDPDFSLREFVEQHFYRHEVHKPEYHTSDTIGIRDHITELWSVLERRNRINRGSLFALPYRYVVPGGRFEEQFYWDSYFIMLGLAADKRWDVIEGMIKNYTYMIRKYGFIPTANRTYFLSRSQPPMFSHMVKLLARQKGKRILVEYLPYLLAEHKFWMKGKTKLQTTEFGSLRRVVQMPNGLMMNRYYDNKSTPRPESHTEDVETAQNAHEREADRLYLHLRAAAESGWDFSSRWFSDPNDIKTIHTADVIPVDLNSLLYHLESTIAEAYRYLRNDISSKRYALYAERRARAINEYCWDESLRFFTDYNFHTHHSTERLTLAAVFPLFVGVATSAQAAAVAKRLEDEFLQSGGLVSTLIENGQQWDSPNGWAPLQWVAIEGLRRYGYHALADEIRGRWMAVNERVFTSKRKLIEKYNVKDENGLGGGGEYPLQDGFGWSNGVYAALFDEDGRTRK